MIKVPASGFSRKGGHGQGHGRGQARSARFLNRYPVLLVVPVSALFLGISLAYATGLAGSWGDISGARAAAAVAGVALGAALAIAAVLGQRQGGGAPWLIVLAVLLIAGFIVTRNEVAPAANDAGKVTTQFEAAVFAFCATLWCLSGLGFLGLLPRLWRSRMAFSQPGPSMHITRAPHWSDASAAPIALSEWLRFTESRDDLRACDSRQPELAERRAVTDRQARASRDLIATRPDLIARNPELAQVLPSGFEVSTYAYERDDGSRLYLTWFNGEIVVAGLRRDRAGDIARMQPVAWALAAHLVDEDGTVYEPA
ncbi:MAG TPA: hypothetical protein VFQ44_24695 [Streptosporangiaceae bacterium]|nr:hypothetical protein [Streptosporangiaceae bacterium]